MPINTDILNKLLITWDSEPDKSTGLIDVNPDDFNYKFIVRYTDIASDRSNPDIIQRTVISPIEKNCFFNKRFGSDISMDKEDAMKLYNIILSRINWLYESEERLKSITEDLATIAGPRSNFFDEYGTGIFLKDGSLWMPGWMTFTFLFAVQNIFIKIVYGRHPEEEIYSGYIDGLMDDDGLFYFGRYLQSIKEEAFATVNFPEAFALYLEKMPRARINKLENSVTISVNPDNYVTVRPWPDKFNISENISLKKNELWNVLKSYASTLYKKSNIN